MTLEQKVGQLMVFGFCGPVIKPDVVELITKYHVGGLRISQFLRKITLANDVKPGEEIDEITMLSMHQATGLIHEPLSVKHVPAARPGEYAETLNRLRTMAAERPLGIPLHYTVDMEGSGSDDLLGGQRLFPHPMGLAATQDPQIAYKVALCIGKQARAVGANMIHSPTLDVNTNPKNPEIGTRAYSDNTGTVQAFALQSLRGFKESGLIATGKHFPGRGESMADAHFGLPTVNLNRKTLMDVHLAPYIALIKAGLPAIMSAHSIYPALGETERPASLSRTILTDFLRGELGFEGIITTDNMMMGGILKKIEMSEAVVQALIAGNDLILCRDESPITIKILDKVLEAVKKKRLSEAELDQKIQRILRMRWDMDLVNRGGVVDTAAADASIQERVVINTAVEAAERSLCLLRDTARALPVSPDKKVLLIEQVFPSHVAANNMYCHPGLLWELLCEHTRNIAGIEIANVPTKEDAIRVRRRLKEESFDVIVTTNYYYHKVAASNSTLVRECMQTGKPVIVISNTPYEFGAPAEFPTVIACFNPGGREGIEAVAKAIFGKLVLTGKVPIEKV